MMLNPLTGLILAIFLISNAFSQQVNIIPRPVNLEIREGNFIIDKQASLKYEVSNKELQSAALLLRNFINDVSGIRMPVNARMKKAVELQFVKDPKLGNEGYRLSVDNHRIRIQANKKGGIIYGIQSLIQMMPAIRTNAVLRIPAMEITDYPRFSWRGMHLDVCRHFFSVETVKEYIDLLSLYKFNTFHWHLTDDQGWRVEIKKYPKLTQVGAWRGVRKGIPWDESEPSVPGEPLTYGGYYTREQIRDIVKYASERNITIVPEIDVPGHS